MTAMVCDAAIDTVPSVPMLTLLVVPGVVWSMPTLPSKFVPAGRALVIAVTAVTVAMFHVPLWLTCWTSDPTNVVAAFTSGRKLDTSISAIART